MGQLSPHVFGTGRIGASMLSACVGDELHEVGARMVSDFFEMDGWDTHFLGANVPTRALLAMAQAQRCNVLCLSVTMTSHIAVASDIVAAVRAQEALTNLRIIVGGMPFNIEPELWRRIGADGHARDAASAVELARRLALG
jgi:methanogenic corrinoid protein MtbC1